MAVISTAIARPALSAEQRAALPAARSLIHLAPLIVLSYAVLIPSEARFAFAGQNIYMPRLVELVCLPWLLSIIARGRFPFRPADLLMVAGAAWMVLSFAVFYGPGEGVRRGTALALDTLVPYLIARACIRDATDLRRLLVLIAPGFFVAGMSMAAESLTHQHFVRPIFIRIFGYLPIYEDGTAVSILGVRDEVRLGLQRSGGPFAHPILAGVIMASLLPLYLRSNLRSWPRPLGIAASLCAVFSVSSGAFLTLIVILALVAYDRLQRMITVLTWGRFMLAVGMMLAAGQILSQNGITAAIGRLTINPATAAYRRMIWQYGSLSVERHPWFGIGFSNYDRPGWMTSSVDHHWLLLAMRHGLIVPVFFGLAVFVALWLAFRRSAVLPALDRNLVFAAAVSLLAFAIAGLTVAFFGSALAWFNILLGLTMSLGLSASASGALRPPGLVGRAPLDRTAQTAAERSGNRLASKTRRVL